MKHKISLSLLNQWERLAFIATLEGVFEHSSWVAKQVWEQRPFASLDVLHQAMVAIVRRASPERQLALIRAHPELAGRAAEIGGLTRESTEEQASAGLNQCTPEELADLRRLNQTYRAKFGFPFVMAVKGHTKAEILAALRERLDYTAAREHEQALAEIAKIARLRLADLIEPYSF